MDASGLLLTDLYEVTMAAGYVRRGMREPATFSLFVRTLPESRGFLVAAGLEEVLDRLTDFEVTGEDVVWLADRLGCSPGELEALSGLGFEGDVWAVPEGRIVFPGEPLVEVTAPLPEAQLVETTVVNAVTYQTVLASKAARCVLAAGGRPVVDFGLRRAHGAEAGIEAARAGAMVGFAATSNVAAGQRYGIPVTGTMAHSYVQAFPSEWAAFNAFADDFPATPTFLVDTYDLGAGLAAAIEVIHVRGLADRAAVRLDSGDPAQTAPFARRMLDAAGLPGVRIVASGGLDEYALDRLVRTGAPVDVFAVGTKVTTSADAPVLDSAYKLVQLGDRPTRKRSPGKATLPGPKQVWRPPAGPDLLCRRDEAGQTGSEALLVPVMRRGCRIDPPAPPRVALESAHERFRRDLAWLPGDAGDVLHPAQPEPRTSDALLALRDDVDAALEHGRTHGTP
ncbi:MAG: nicotinate phosphoribosyltransferase [Actinomycetes bacterium]